MAQQAALANQVGGAGLILSDADIVFGLATPNPADPTGRFLFSAHNPSVNSIRIQGRRTPDSPSGAVSLFLGQSVFGRGNFEASRSATGAIADRDIVLVVDRSGSMDQRDAGRLPAALVAEYGPGTLLNLSGTLRRMDALKVSVNEFRKVIDDLPSVEKLGMVSYSTRATTDSNLNFNYSLFDSTILNMLPSGRTNIGAGIDEAQRMLRNKSLTRASAVPVMIVLTDGLHNETRNPETAARDAMRALPRLTIHTITFSNSADRTRMRRVAEIGQGIYVHADDVSQLVGQFELMARSAGAVLIE